MPDLSSPNPAPTTLAPQDAARPLVVRRITAEEHGRFLADHPDASFLQNPQWPQVKTDWRGESVGFFDGGDGTGEHGTGQQGTGQQGTMRAAALVLFRRLPVPVPVLRNRSLAYIAEGPVFDRSQVALESVLPPLVTYLKTRGAFLVRVGLPGVVRQWDGSVVRKALAAGEHRSITGLEPVHTDPAAEEVRARLLAMGWQAPSESESFEAGQPQFQARIPLQPELVGQEPDGGGARGKETEDPAVLAALSRMDSTSRRQTRKSTRSELTVTVGTEADLPAWQELYEETARRDGFTGRPLAYFQRMFRALNSSPGASSGSSSDSACTLYLAHYGDQLLAAAIYVRQGGFGWYVYGASSSEERKRYAPRGLQLRQLEDSLAAGCRWYDLGGLSPSLDPEHELAGLTRFKTTMGADVVQTYGEWDYPVNRVLAKAFNLYMARRAAG